MKIRFVAYRLDEIMGMGRALLSIAASLQHEHDVEVVVLRGTVHPAVLEALGKATFRSTPADITRAMLPFGASVADVEVLVGLWASTCWIPGHLAVGSRRIVWEHTLVEERRADERVMKLARLNRRAYSRARRVVAVSPAVARMVEGLQMSSHVEVIPNAIIELDRFETELKRDPAHLVSMHTLNPLKNTELSIRTLAILPDEFRLTICGDGASRARLEALAAEVGVRDRCTFLGYVGDIQPILATAGVVVHPSLSETFCLTLYEAASLCVPVACLDLEAYSGAIPKYVVGAIAERNDSEAFAEAIQAAREMSNDAESFLLARKARQEDLDPSVIAARWACLFKETI